MRRSILGSGLWAAIDCGYSASVPGLSDENVEIILRNFLQAHPAIRSMRALALPVRQSFGGCQAGPRLAGSRQNHSLGGAGVRRWKTKSQVKMREIILSARLLG